MTTPAPPRALRLLIVEDVASDADLMVRELRRAGYAPDWDVVEDEARYLAAIARPLDLILCDYMLPQFGALRALELLRDRGADVPLIVVTGAVGEEKAVDCIKHGAVDCLLKDRLARLGTAVGQAITQAVERRRLREAEAVALRAGQMEQRLDGVKLAMREVAHLLNNNLALAVGTIDLLQADPSLSPEAREGLLTAVAALEEAARHLVRFQRVVRVETQESPVGLMLDVERSICSCMHAATTFCTGHRAA